MLDLGFYGRHERSVDEKGRVFVPKPLLDLYPPEKGAEEGKAMLILTLGIEKCLVLFTPVAWQELMSRITTLSTPENRRKLRALERRLEANAALCVLDKTGRILLPKRHRDYAGIERDITFVGRGDKIEIWDTSSLEAAEAHDEPDAVEMGHQVL